MPARIPANASEVSLRWVTLAVLLPTWMALLDGTIVTVGLDTIAGNLGVSVDEASWIASIYPITAVFVMPLTGWFSANVGRKRSLLLAIGIFTAASLLCALSGTLAELVAMRALQGLGGGLMIPLAMAALIDAYPAARLPTAFKVYGAAAMVAPALGPALGGWLLTNFTWPWIFLVNIPLGLFAMWLVSGVVREQSARGERSSFDWTSLSVLIVGLLALQFVIQEGPHDDWFASPEVVAALALAVVMLTIFVRMQLAARIPFVDLRPLAIPTFAVGLILALLTGVGFTGTALVAPLYMQEVLRYSPDYAGLVMVPTAIGGFIGTEFSGRLTAKVPASLLAASSLAVAAAGTFWLASLGDRISFGDALLPRFVQGIGLGLLYVPLNMLMMTQVPKRLLDAASGLGGIVRQIGAGLGFAILGTLIVNTQIAATSTLGARARQGAVLTDPGLGAVYRWFISHGYNDNDAQAFSSSVVGELVNRAAITAAFSETFIIVGLLFVGALPFLVLFHLVRGKELEST
jgi:DHA2 family multidrug resistance protein